MTERPDEELQALCDAATPGPWYVVEPPFIESDMVPFIVAGSPSPDGGRFVCDLDNMSGEAPANPFADASFIAAARSALPSLLARVVAAEKKLAADSVYVEIANERERAHRKHQATSMEAQPVDAILRLAILMEEVGEVAKEFNEARHRGDETPDLVAVRKELVQVAAMAACWADNIAGNTLIRAALADEVTR